MNRQGKVRYLDTRGPSMARRSTRPWERRHLLSTDWGQGVKVRYLDTSGPSMARRSTHPWERRHLLSTDWGLGDIHLTTCPSPSAQTSAHTKSWRSLAGSMEFKIRCKTTSMRHRPGRDNEQ